MHPSRGATSVEGAVMISGVSNIIIPVDDQGRAKAFWTETIGFEVLVDAPYREERWIEVRSPDGVRLVLSTRKEWSHGDRRVGRSPDVERDVPLRRRGGDLRGG
jgi:catechol 2,3-dioxygenase-like lactoylglutathione lyase family enzyme